MSLMMGYQNQVVPQVSNSEGKKIFCAYHRTQFLTNFCIEKQCLMPLCPSCVAQHTQEHFQTSQKPTYVNLNQVLHEVKQKCYANIVSLEQCNRKNDQFIRYRQNIQQNIHQQLMEKKQQIYAKIDLIFQKYQIKLVKQIQQKYLQLTVYQQEQNQTIKQYINQQIQILYDKINMLKGDQCLAALIRFYDYELQQYEQGLKDVHEYLNKHKRVGSALIKLNTESMNIKLQNLCEDLLILHHIKDEDKSKDDGKQNIRNSKIKKNSTNNNNNNNNNNNILINTSNLKQKNNFKNINEKNKISTQNYQSKAKKYNIY